jgi:hypothetical protein
MDEMLNNPPMPYRDFAMWLRGVLEMRFAGLGAADIQIILEKLNAIETTVTNDGPHPRC